MDQQDKDKVCGKWLKTARGSGRHVSYLTVKLRTSALARAVPNGYSVEAFGVLAGDQCDA